MGNTSRYTWSSDGRMNTFTDGKGNATRYGYDGSGNLTSITYADGGSESWTFAITLGGVRAILAPEFEAANGNVSDQLVGFVSIEWREAGNRTGWHLGYWLAEEHWGKGIMTDAVNAASTLNSQKEQRGALRRWC